MNKESRFDPSESSEYPTSPRVPPLSPPTQQASAYPSFPPCYEPNTNYGFFSPNSAPDSFSGVQAQYSPFNNVPSSAPPYPIVSTVQQDILSHQNTYPPSSSSGAFDHGVSSRENVFAFPPKNQPQKPKLKKGPSIGFEDLIDSGSLGLYPNLPQETTLDIHPSDFNNEQSSSVTPVPPNLTLLWESSKPVAIYFVQQEGHVVFPDQTFGCSAFKCPPGNALNSTVLLKVEETWRLGLSKQKSFIVKGLQGEFAFYDNSTSPARYAVIALPKEMPKEEKQRLEVLLKSSASLLDEPSNIYDKVENGVENVFESLTQSIDSLVKKGTPDLHKNTKWLRKGTGQVVRFGGNLVSKGIHMVSDNVMEKNAPKEALKNHKELFHALKVYREAVEKNSFTRISSHSFS